MCDLTRPHAAPLPHGVQSAPLARAFVARSLCHHHARAARSSAGLVTSELLNQLLIDGDLPQEVVVDCGVSELRISLTGTPGAKPEDLEPAVQDVSALLLRTLAKEWGETSTGGDPDRREYWCTVATGFAPPRALAETWLG